MTQMIIDVPEKCFTTLRILASKERDKNHDATAVSVAKDILMKAVEERAITEEELIQFYKKMEDFRSLCEIYEEKLKGLGKEVAPAADKKNETAVKAEPGVCHEYLPPSIVDRKIATYLEDAVEPVRRTELVKNLNLSIYLIDKSCKRLIEAGKITHLVSRYGIKNQLEAHAYQWIRKEQAKEVPKEVPKEAPKEVPKEAPKEAPKEVPKAVPPKETPKEAPALSGKDLFGMKGVYDAIALELYNRMMKGLDDLGGWDAYDVVVKADPALKKKTSAEVLKASKELLELMATVPTKYGIIVKQTSTNTFKGIHGGHSPKYGISAYVKAQGLLNKE